MERPLRFELRPSAWKADVLPLNTTGANLKSKRAISNIILMALLCKTYVLEFNCVDTIDKSMTILFEKLHNVEDLLREAS